MQLSLKSQDRLAAVHPDLRRVIERAALMYPGHFVVTEGERTLDKQRKLVLIGASATVRSRHVRAMNECDEVCAVDLAVFIDTDNDLNPDAGEIRWDWPLYHELARYVKEAAAFERVPIEWGGDWDKFPDGPHFQLPWKEYP